MIATAAAGLADGAALYLRLAGASLRSQMQYRWSFLADVAGNMVALVTEFAAIVVLFRHVPTLGQWSLPEVAFLYGTAEAALGAAKVLFAGFDTVPDLVRTGDFDALLTRPRSTFLQVLALELRLRHLARLGQAAPVLAWGLIQLDPGWGPGQWAFLAWTILWGAAFFASLFVIGAALSFWTVESLEVVNIFTYGGSAMASYPMSIYAQGLREFFTFLVPLAFVNYYPALYLLGKPDPFNGPAAMPFLAAPACGAILVAAVAFWGAGVRHYHSTGH